MDGSPSPAFDAAGLAQRAHALIEVTPAASGDAAAVAGFALTWALWTSAGGLVFWASPERDGAENGAPYAEGLAQYGMSLEALILARTHSQADALWAAEQALTLPGASVLCTIIPAAKPLSLTATRRLLLAAEKNQSRCILLRLDAAAASAAFLRWSVTSAPSQGAARELGRPAFLARLTRHRAGPSGQSWRFEWNAHDQILHAAEAALDGDLAAALADRSAEPRRRRAV